MAYRKFSPSTSYKRVDNFFFLIFFFFFLTKDFKKKKKKSPSWVALCHGLTGLTPSPLHRPAQDIPFSKVYTETWKRVKYHTSLKRLINEMSLMKTIFQIHNLQSKGTLPSLHALETKIHRNVSLTTKKKIHLNKKKTFFHTIFSLTCL